MPNIVRQATAEEKELENKLAELADLQVHLAEAELHLSTAKDALLQFEAQYDRALSRRYAELDDLRAKIAAELANRNPDDPVAQQTASRARNHANDSAHAAAHRPPHPMADPPSEELKKLFRAVAKAIHPDLTTDSFERARRTSLMSKANAAYEQRDEAALDRILSDWSSGPDAVVGEDTAAQLVRAIRKISQVRRRLEDIDLEFAQLRSDPMYKLMNEVASARLEGRDLLVEMAAEVDGQIREERERLEALPSS